MNLLGITSMLASSMLAPSLTFDASAFQVQSATFNGTTLTYRAYEDISYVQKPVDPKFQTLNVYVPLTLAEGKTVNGYTLKTAPIFFANSVGGYMPGAAKRPGGRTMNGVDTLLAALDHGYVVVAPGARGRTLKDESGRFTGKAPAAIVDLKAAVRYVRANRANFPGNVDRIVSNGTSAGGALSALLGATGNSKDYDPYLQALGAANAPDDVWAVSSYCPITNLDNADSAYEWLLSTVHEASGRGPRPGTPGPARPMTDDQVRQAELLKAAFPAYVNQLGLRSGNQKLTLAPDGTGTFRDYIEGKLKESAERALATGQDPALSGWVTVTEGKVTKIDWDGFVRKVGRMKSTTAFDGLSLGTGENNLFGTETTDNQHFTAFGMANRTDPNSTLADAKIVKMMNPMSYIGQKGSTTAKLWRIRHGAIDRDTSVAIPAILALKLAQSGCEVDFAYPWNTPHSGDYDLAELFAWIDTHAKSTRN